MSMGLFASGYNHQAGGIHVESMYGWLGDAVGEQRSDPAYHAVLHVRASAGYREKAAGLVDHQKQGVDEENFHAATLYDPASHPGRRA